MAQFAPHTLLTWGGDLYGERWQNGFRLLGVGGNIEAALDAYVPLLKAFYSTGDYTSSLTMDFVKLNEVGADGKYLSNVTHQRVLLGTARGQGASTAAAMRPLPQAAIVATLRTPVARGHASKGRIFLAGNVNSVTLDTTGRLGAGVGTAIANTVAGLINSVNAAAPASSAGWPGTVCIHSALEPVAHKVTSVEVGRVVDTQRRRRSSLVEAREVASTHIT